MTVEYHTEGSITGALPQEQVVDVGVGTLMGLGDVAPPRPRPGSGPPPRRSELVARLAAQIVRHRCQLSLRPGRAEQSLAEIGRIVDAVVARDPEAADAAARAHLHMVIIAVRAEAPD